MDDDLELAPWDFDRDLLELPFPTGFSYPTLRTAAGEEKTFEARTYGLSDTTVVMVDWPLDGDVEDLGALAQIAWASAGSPAPFRLVWHSFERWGDGYWESVWKADDRGRPVVEMGSDGIARLVLDHETTDADALMRRLATEA